MEDKPFENYRPDLFPRIEAVSKALGRVLMLGRVVEPSLSNHKPRGASELLDDVMYGQLELDYDSRD